MSDYGTPTVSGGREPDEKVALDFEGLFRADLAFLDVVRQGGTQAEAVRAAIHAYLDDALIIRRDENGEWPRAVIDHMIEDLKTRQRVADETGAHGFWLDPRFILDALASSQGVEHG